jgi:hypothetical protein
MNFDVILKFTDKKKLEEINNNNYDVRLYTTPWICHLRQFSTGLRLSMWRAEKLAWLS